MIPFITENGDCPYLPGRPWRTENLLPESLTAEEYERLLEAGCRRAGRMVYRPSCEGCRECVPLRVPAARFVPGRTQRKVWRRNADIEVSVGPPRLSPDRVELYRRYIEGRFPVRPGAAVPAGTALRKAPSARLEYQSDFMAHYGWTMEFSYRLEGRLVGVGIVDAVPKAASSVYFFYDLAQARRRLGVFSILKEIEFCRQTGRDFLYLGYWVRDCRSMRYKADYKPHETHREERGWRPA